MSSALAGDQAECAAFAMGDTVIEAMAGAEGHRPWNKFRVTVELFAGSYFASASIFAAAGLLQSSAPT